MKQHILRLLIVLVLVVGIGLIIFYSVRDNAPFIVENYVYAETEKIEDVKEKFINLNSKVDSKFSENIVIFNSFEESVNYYVTILNNSKITKSQANEIKSLYLDFNKKSNEIRNSLISVDNYLKLDISEQNAGELAGRKERLNEDFNSLNKSYFKVVEKFESIVKENIYNGLNFDVYASILSCRNLMNSAYLTFGTNFTLISKVNSRLLALKNNNFNANIDAVKFSIKYNEFEKNLWQNDINKYFENQTSNNNLNILLGFLNSEVYYEEV